MGFRRFGADPTQAFSGAAERTVMIAMITVWMMQVAVDQIVDVIAVRHRLVTTAGAVPVSAGVTAALVLRRAAARIGSVYGDDMFVDVTVMHVVEMSVMQIIHMPGMADADMAAIGAMLVRMVGVLGVGTGIHIHISVLMR